MSRADSDDAAPEEPPVAWHNRTSTLLGVSVAGLAALAVVLGLISYVAQSFSEPEPAPLYYVPPSATSGSGTRSATASTTPETITSTSPPMTTDINGDAPPSTTSGSESTAPPSTRAPRTRETDVEEDEAEDEEPETTRSRPRTNVTRTLYPGT